MTEASPLQVLRMAFKKDTEWDKVSVPLIEVQIVHHESQKKQAPP